MPAQRAAPITVAEIAGMSLPELRVFAFAAWTSAARRRLTLADLALVPAPNGRPLGVRTAVQVLRDLQDTGAITTSGSIDAAGGVAVSVAGHLAPPPPATPPAPTRPAPARSAPPVPTQRDGTPIPVAGRIGILLIPCNLPAQLRENLLKLTEEFRAHQLAPADTARTADLLDRKAAALEQWAALPPPYGTVRVRQEAERTRAAADYALQMHHNRQQRAGGAEHATS